MNVIRRTDPYDSHKVWIVKHTKCGHYYLNQEICGKLFYSAFRRTTKKHIMEIFS